MPFYFKLIYFIKESVKKPKELATLQVQYLYKYNLGKRVYVNASLSVEAAMSFSVFILIMLSLSALFSMLNTHRKVQAIVDKLTKEASMYAYIYTFEEDNKDGYGDFGGTLGETAIVSLGRLNILRLKESKNISSLNLSCDFLEDGENISLAAEYKYVLPFSIFGKNKISQKTFSLRRAYIGKESRKKDEEEEKEDEELVYVGKNPSRYHMNRSCHYLFNNISKIRFEDISKMRNKSGTKYTACDRCAKGHKASTVYILPSGKSYHIDKNCSAIRAYVRVVKKAEVEHLGACSYCGGE